MYTLIGSPKSRAFRVTWLLEELELPYTVVPARPGSEEAKAHNPSGKIPVLLVDGVAIPDSVAIIQFLADRYGRFTYPAGSVERAIQDSFTHFAVDELDGSCWQFSKHSFAHPEDLRCEEAKKGCVHDFARAQASLEQRLGDKLHVMGDEITVPDFVIAHVAGWAKACGFEWRPGKVSEYYERVRSRPAFRRAWEKRESA